MLAYTGKELKDIVRPEKVNVKLSVKKFRISFDL